MAFQMRTPLFQATYTRPTDEEINAMPKKGTKQVAVTPSTENNRRERKQLAADMASAIVGGGGNINTVGAASSGSRSAGTVTGGNTAYLGTESDNAPSEGFASMSVGKLGRKIKQTLRESGSVKVDPTSGTISSSSEPVYRETSYNPRAEAIKERKVRDFQEQDAAHKKQISEKKAAMAEAQKIKVSENVAKHAAAKAANQAKRTASKSPVEQNKTPFYQKGFLQDTNMLTNNNKYTTATSALRQEKKVGSTTTESIVERDGKKYKQWKTDDSYETPGTSGSKTKPTGDKPMSDSKWSKFVAANPNWDKGSDASKRTETSMQEREILEPIQTKSAGVVKKGNPEIKAPLMPVPTKTKKVIGGQTSGTTRNTSLTNTVNAVKSVTKGVGNAVKGAASAAGGIVPDIGCDTCKNQKKNPS